MHIVNNLMKFLRWNLFSTTKFYIQIYKKRVKDMKNHKNKNKGKSLSLTSKQKTKTKLCD